MPLIRLVYSSAAAGEMPYGTLVEIMDHAQRRNVARGITGILCYGSGQFLQALEGERAAVTALYHRIAVDPRHDGCELIAVDEVMARAFPEWTMKVVNWDGGDSTRRRAVLAADTGSDVFDPRGMTATQANTFLQHLAELERELAAD